jgi:hypothetical protein
MDAYGVVTFDSTTGANQPSEVFASRIQREFLRNQRCPSEVEYHANYHPSTWYGRGSRSCKLQVDAIRSERTAFRLALNRVQVAAVTVNTTPAGLWKCTLYLYNGSLRGKFGPCRTDCGFADQWSRSTDFSSFLQLVNGHEFCS